MFEVPAFSGRNFGWVKHGKTLNQNQLSPGFFLFNKMSKDTHSLM